VVGDDVAGVTVARDGRGAPTVDRVTAARRRSAGSRRDPGTGRPFRGTRRPPARPVPPALHVRLWGYRGPLRTRLGPGHLEPAVSAAGVRPTGRRARWVRPGYNLARGPLVRPRLPRAGCPARRGCQVKGQLGGAAPAQARPWAPTGTGGRSRRCPFWCAGGGSETRGGPGLGSAARVGRVSPRGGAGPRPRGGRTELGVGGDQQPGPPVGRLRGADLRSCLAQGLLEQPEGVFEIESSQEGLPPPVHITSGGGGDRGPQPDRLGVAVAEQGLDLQPDEGALDDGQLAVVVCPAAALRQPRCSRSQLVAVAVP
jgi:hypothetical protein